MQKAKKREGFAKPLKARKEEDEEKGYPDEEQGIEPEVHGEKEALKMDIGEKEEEIYDETGRRKLVEEDEISDAEEGFVEGYEGKGALGACGLCSKMLSEDKTIEREVGGKMLWFCSNACAKNYVLKKKPAAENEKSEKKKKGKK